MTMVIVNDLEKTQENPGLCLGLELLLGFECLSFAFAKVPNLRLILLTLTTFTAAKEMAEMILERSQ